mgnify:CR=1 FL=1
MNFGGILIMRNDKNIIASFGDDFFYQGEFVKLGEKDFILFGMHSPFNQFCLRVNPSGCMTVKFVDYVKIELKEFFRFTSHGGSINTFECNPSEELINDFRVVIDRCRGIINNALRLKDVIPMIDGDWKSAVTKPLMLVNEEELYYGVCSKVFASEDCSVKLTPSVLDERYPFYTGPCGFKVVYVDGGLKLYTFDLSL